VGFGGGGLLPCIGGAVASAFKLDPSNFLAPDGPDITGFGLLSGCPTGVEVEFAPSVLRISDGPDITGVGFACDLLSLLIEAFIFLTMVSRLLGGAESEGVLWTYCLFMRAMKSSMLFLSTCIKCWILNGFPTSSS